MTLWLIASSLTLLVLLCGIVGVRATVRLAVLSGQRLGHLFQNAPTAGASAWRTAFGAMRALDEVQHRISQDPELARLQRKRDVCLMTAAILFVPAAYCMAIAVGRLLSA